MAERLLPISPSAVRIRTAGSALIAACGLAAFVWGVVTAHPSGGVVAFFGVLCMAAFGPVAMVSLRTLRTGGLLLTSKGYVLSGYTIAWSDIEGFSLPDGEAGITHIKVRFAPHARLTGWASMSQDLARIGLYTAPAVIPIHDFATDGAYLPDILTRWWKRYRDA